MKVLEQEIDFAAKIDTSLLLWGPSGCGKELVARLIHRTSSRGRREFVRVDCRRIPGLVYNAHGQPDSDYEYRSTDAFWASQFELARGGVLFLHGVDWMTEGAQKSLSRALQGLEVPSGATADRAGVQVISSTQADLADEVLGNRFRMDLFRRLGAFPIRIPGLTDRGADLRRLVELYLSREQNWTGRSVDLSPALLETIEKRAWTGNVRQLFSFLEDWLRTDGRVDTGDDEISPSRPPPLDPFDGLTLRQATVAFQDRLIHSTLRAFGGNMSRAAARLGVDRSNFFRRVKKGAEEPPDRDLAEKKNPS